MSKLDFGELSAWSLIIGLIVADLVCPGLWLNGWEIVALSAIWAVLNLGYGWWYDRRNKDG